MGKKNVLVLTLVIFPMSYDIFFLSFQNSFAIRGPWRRVTQTKRKGRRRIWDKRRQPANITFVSFGCNSSKNQLSFLFIETYSRVSIFLPTQWKYMMWFHLNIIRNVLISFSTLCETFFIWSMSSAASFYFQACLHVVASARIRLPSGLQ